MVCFKFFIALQVQIALRVLADGKEVTELRSNAEDLRLEATHSIAGAAIAANFLVGVTHQTDQKLLAQELRHTPIEMHVDAVLILRGCVF